MELELVGKKVLITGGSKGIGLACARAFAAEGANLALAARDFGVLKDVTRELRTSYADRNVDVTSHSCDLAKPEHQEALVDVVGDVDILINNAGAIPAGDLQSVDDKTWRAAWDVKVFGYINLTRLLLPRMQARGSGVVVNVIGAAAEYPRPDYIAGSTANAALVNFTKALGSQTFEHGVRVVGVSPGPTMTDRMITMLRHDAQTRFGNPELWEQLVRDDPSPADPREVADVVVFAASARASHLNGTTVTLDGGAIG